VFFDPTPIIWMGIGLGAIGLMVWSTAYSAYRQKRLRSQMDETLARGRRNSELVERNTELHEQEIQLLEDMLRRQDEMIRLLRQIAQKRTDPLENIQERGSLNQNS
jgi:hypothetical protein